MAKNNQNTVQRPAAGITPQPAPKRTGADQDDPELPKKAPKTDRVADFFDRAAYFSGYQFPCLKQTIRGADFFLSVSRYYPNQKVAVDMFYSAHEYAGGNIEFKKAALNREGIKYVFLAPGVAGHDTVKTLDTQIAEQ